ncbi:MAG: pyrroline-5-carboxylate reductase [Bacteroidota bacterium]
MENKNIAILGAGNLGISIAKGLQQSGFLGNRRLILTRRNLSAVESLSDQNISVTSDNLVAVSKADVVMLCVQPKQLDNLLDQIKPTLDSNRHTIISVITAVSLSSLEDKIGKDFAIFRAMPNTAISVGESMTCFDGNEKTTDKANIIEDIFNCVGTTLQIEESLMQAATVVCASGIAFWMRFIRATTQGGVQLGFDAEDAQKIAVQTCLGAATLLSKTDSHPESEIDRVTTPQGCTISGLNEMEHNGLSSALIKGLVTSFDRINEMKKS